MDTQNKFNEIHDKLNSIIHDWYWRDDELNDTINELYPNHNEFMELKDCEYHPCRRRAFLQQLSAAVFRMEYAREVERINHERKNNVCYPES
jgi:hypothetical protein